MNSVALVRARTIPTERPPPVGEVRPTCVLCNSFRVDEEVSFRCFGLWLDSNYDAHVCGKWLVDAEERKNKWPSNFLLKLSLLQLCKITLHMNI